MLVHRGGLQLPKLLQLAPKRLWPRVLRLRTASWGGSAKR